MPSSGRCVPVGTSPGEFRLIWFVLTLANNKGQRLATARGANFWPFLFLSSWLLYTNQSILTATQLERACKEQMSYKSLPLFPLSLSLSFSQFVCFSRHKITRHFSLRVPWWLLSPSFRVPMCHCIIYIGTYTKKTRASESHNGQLNERTRGVCKFDEADQDEEWRNRTVLSLSSLLSSSLSLSLSSCISISNWRSSDY